MTMRTVLVALSLLFSTSVFAQTEVIPMNEAKSSSQGLAYSLPKTILRLHLNTVKLNSTAGPYFRYAERYLGVKNPIMENSVEWILENITMEQVALPDPDNSYLILFRSTPVPTIDLTRDGIIRALNMEYIADKSEETQQKKVEVKEDWGDAKMKVMSEELLMAGSTAKMAEIAAKQIYKIRESRTDLVTGNMDNLPADGESFKLMLKQLDDQEKALTALFVGSTQRESKTITIDIDPTEDVEKQVITRFSKFKGVVDKTDLGGTPVYLTIKTIEKKELIPDPKAARARKGVFYRIPAKVEVSLTGLDNKNWIRENVLIPQMGIVVSLSPNLFDNRRAPLKVLFEPTTGAIRQMIQ